MSISKFERVELEENSCLNLPVQSYGKKTGVWFIRVDEALIGCLKNHNVIEHEDGTITASPSILISNNSEVVHGFLEKGTWRTC